MCDLDDVLVAQGKGREKSSYDAAVLRGFVPGNEAM